MTTTHQTVISLSLCFLILCIGILGCSDAGDTDPVRVPEADGGVPQASIEPDDAEGLKKLTSLAKTGNAQARFELGVFYERAEDYENARFWYSLAAEKDVLAAHVNLGRMYYEGLGTEPDDARAAELFRWGAEKGDAISQYNLGRLYQEGRGVQENDEEARHWIRLAAEQGFADAQNHLGAMFNNGEEPDFEKSKHWYWLACKQGHPHAQYNLGVLYYNGEGVEVDYQRAYLWILLSSRGGHGLAMQNLPAVEAKLETNEIEEAQRLAQDWKNQLATLSP